MADPGTKRAGSRPRFKGRALPDGPPSLQRINAAIADLERGTLDAAQRAFIIGALDYLGIKLIGERDRRRRGRRDTAASVSIKVCAAVVKKLHEDHRVPLKTAAWAMVNADVGTDETRRKAQQSIERAYRKLKASRVAWQVNPDLIQAALARINRK